MHNSSAEVLGGKRHRPTPRSLALLVLLIGASIRPLSAQTFAEADRLLAARDTSGAIAVLEAMIKRDRRDTEARYRAGMLYMSRHVPGSALSPNRRKAEEHFRYATRLASDSAKYWLALAELLRTEEVTTTRMQVAGMVERARREAREHGGDPLGLAEYRAGRIEWERYEHLAHRYLLGPLEGGTDRPERRLDLDAMMDDWVYLREFLEQRVRPDPGHPGEANLIEVEAALRNALQANPRNVQAAGLLAVALGEHERWAEAHEMARDLVRAAPDSGTAHALLALTLARLFRWRQAQAAYDGALGRMSPEQRRPYENLGLIFRMADSVALAARSPADRAVIDSLYWLVNQPLYLNPVNEARLEFYARVTYVIHRWSDPLRGYQGYESDQGAVYVRYGPPDIWATLGRGATTSFAGNALGQLEYERNTILWVYYPTRLRFAFSLTPGYARAVFGSDHPALYRVARNNIPVRFDNVPVVRHLDTIVTQIAQFRGPRPDQTDVVVFASTPTGRMAVASSASDVLLVTAAIVKDPTLRDVVRERRERTVPTGDSLRTDVGTWHLALRPADYLLRVEATLDALDRAARGSARLTVRPFSGESLRLSDIVAADRVQPRDSTAGRWTDFLVAPNAGRFRPDAPVALLWEIYNLVPDSAGLVEYDVEMRFTVQELERRGFVARFLGIIGDATGLSATGDDQVTLSFHRRREASADGRVVEFVDVDLENAPEATYLLTVTVVDRHTGRAASAERRFAVSAFPLTR